MNKKATGRKKILNKEFIDEKGNIYKIVRKADWQNTKKYIIVKNNEMTKSYEKMKEATKEIKIIVKVSQGVSNDTP